jgi:hypothetical protein
MPTVDAAGGWSAPGTVGDTWTFDGTAWTQLKLAGPPGRYGAVMATP